MYLSRDQPASPMTITFTTKLAANIGTIKPLPIFPTSIVNWIRGVKKAGEVPRESTEYVYQEKGEPTIHPANLRTKCEQHPTTKPDVNNPCVLQQMFINRRQFPFCVELAASIKNLTQRFTYRSKSPLIGGLSTSTVCISVIIKRTWRRLISIILGFPKILVFTYISEFRR
ncbi:hypothetical protein Ccrd_012753 [Cynara cardunculus var. scolymus]|uniref:Uncharacterized protein n=1 Tax=Cynara cardunculus var. scolymus TaxID=59895 RepID=A0A103YGV5_CYNCS|nr:hypothetical protein Ccrd_012753 [Cynara cardunculus var. scolymus]